MKGGSIIMADWGHWGGGNTTEEEGGKRQGCYCRGFVRNGIVGNEKTNREKKSTALYKQ
jgi:hypothetical protein